MRGQLMACTMVGLVGWWLAMAVAGNAAAGEKRKIYKVGDKVVDFTSTDDQGKTWKSSDVVGKKIVVLYFYPADFTGGCTAQACAFRDDIEKLKGVEIIGVSGDSAATHKLFKNHHKLNFTLLADENGNLAKSFGIPVGKGGKAKGIAEDGKNIEVVRGATIQRYTVVLDQEGKVAAIDQVKDAKGDARRIQELVKKLEK